LPSQELIIEIKETAKEVLGAIAVPDEVEFVDKLPKTRSGKIIRIVLRARELGQKLGDI
jgi:acetyl-CoA synthetase